MLGDINKNLQIPHYHLTLCKPDRTPIAILQEMYDFVYTPQLGSIDEIEFKIPFYVLQDHKQVKNPHWDKLCGDYSILVEQGYKYKYFIIDTPKSIGTEDEKVKIIHGYSQEYELSKKLVRSYQDGQGNPKIVKLYDEINAENGILNYLTTLTSWSIGNIDADLLNTWRSFKIDEDTWLGVANQIQKSFQCIFLYDTVNKRIDIKPVEKIGMNRGLYITEENYITNFEEEFKHDEVVTRLYAYGKDNISFNEVNPTGESFIEDFSFFKSLKYMSQELITALNNYEALVASKQGDFQNYLTQLDGYNTQLYGDGTPSNLGLYAEKTQLENELTIILDNIDLAIKRGDNTALATHNAQKTAKDIEINNKQTAINIVVENITTVKNNINTLKNQLAKENNFTTQQIVELDFFIREKTWSDSNYYDVNELYQDAKKYLVKLSQPPIEFTISVVDFLQIVECQHDWNKINLGDIVNIQYGIYNVYFKVRLIAYTHAVDSNDLQLTFSNKDSIDDPNVYLNEVLQQAVSTSTSLDMSRFKWDRSEDNYNMVREILDNEWDSAKRRILVGRNQDIVMDDRGISLTDKTAPNEQLRLLNNVISMTTDGWNSTKLAITPQGVYAERLIGQIIAGENLIITNGDNNFQVDGNGITVSSNNLNVQAGTNGVNISALEGIIVTKSDNKNRTILNATQGIKIQKTNGSGGWIDKLYADTNGDLVVQDLTANNIIINGGTLKAGTTTLIDLTTKKIDFAQFTTILGKTEFMKGIAVKDTSGNTTFGVDTNGLITIRGTVHMGAGSTITWDSLPSDVASVSDIENVPSYITATKITQTSIESPTITGGTITGAIVRSLDASGRGVMLNSNSVQIYSGTGVVAGSLTYDTSGAGTTEEAKNRVFLSTVSGVALKLQSGGDMSISSATSTGKVYIKNPVFYGTIPTLVAVFG